MKSSQGWSQGEHDALPWLSYFLGVLVKACNDLEGRMDQAMKAGGGSGAKATLVRQAVENAPLPFTSDDIARACPAVSPHTIRKVMDEMRAEGKIALVRKGRNARWVRSDPTTLEP